MSFYLAYNFGILYIVLSTFATLWTERYHQSVSVSGLHYIALALGYTLAAQVGARITDASGSTSRLRLMARRSQSTAFH